MLEVGHETYDELFMSIYAVTQTQTYTHTLTLMAHLKFYLMITSGGVIMLNHAFELFSQVRHELITH